MIAWVAVALGGTHDAQLLDLLQSTHGLSEAQTETVRGILARSDRLGFGLDPISVHAADAAACAAAREGWVDDPRTAVCGRPNMAPLYDPATQRPEDATVCIDQYEFPNVPCSFPVVWVRAGEAAAICEAMGKRLCDAHEWEGACAGSLGPADYPWDARVTDAGASQKAFRALHNARYADTWKPSAEVPPGTCATGSFKHDDCDGSDWRKCGSNTYPTGMFPACRSEALPVYDLWGNAAEHMNLPLAPDQRSRPGGPLGLTEMKGSWFVWDKVNAHEDGCRWRAPYWHGGPVRAADSHRNYHLGFRCCSDR